MEDVAPKITERLYGDDKIKYELILTILYLEQKFGNIREVAKYNSEGNFDEYIMGIIEHIEDNTDLEKLDHKSARSRDIPISEWKKIRNCFED